MCVQECNKWFKSPMKESLASINNALSSSLPLIVCLKPVTWLTSDDENTSHMIDFWWSELVTWLTSDAKNQSHDWLSDDENQSHDWLLMIRTGHMIDFWCQEPVTWLTFWWWEPVTWLTSDDENWSHDWFWWWELATIDFDLMIRPTLWGGQESAIG